jgi:hypothetical protein
MNINNVISCGALAGSNDAQDRRPPTKRLKGAEVIASSASRGPHNTPGCAGGSIAAHGPETAASRAATLVPTNPPAVLGGNRPKARITTPQVRTRNSFCGTPKVSARLCISTCTSPTAALRAATPTLGRGLAVEVDVGSCCADGPIPCICRLIMVWYSSFL